MPFSPFKKIAENYLVLCSQDKYKNDDVHILKGMFAIQVTHSKHATACLD